MITAHSIDGCPVLLDRHTGRRYLLAHRGRYYRFGHAWMFVRRDGERMMVTVPATVAALEARDTRELVTA